MKTAPISSLHTDGSLMFRLAGAIPKTPQRLLLLLHGVGGNETNLGILADQAADDTLVVLPRAPLDMGMGQYAWFPVSFGPQGPRPDLAAAEQSRQRLAAFVAELQARYDVLPAKTVVAGFSQGGIISASIGLTYPNLVRSFGILAGRILPEIKPLLADREALARIEAFIGHGRDDTKLTVDWAHKADAWLSELGIPHEIHLYSGDHGIPPAMQDDFFAWFERLTQG